MARHKIPVFFHPKQLDHKPRYEWAFGERIDHPETTYRAENIFRALSSDATAFSIQEPSQIPLEWIERTHDRRLIRIYQTAAKVLKEGETLHPSVFPKRNRYRANARSIHQAGFFCYDAGTPLTTNVWEAAAWSAACSFEAVLCVEEGRSSIAYGLCRPPGHHASRDLFGGYCYFNNAALSAMRFREKGRVVILDIDFHHGNGTQEIFYRDREVLVISIHGRPEEYYPYFCGYEEERGRGEGKGFNLNLPLPKGCDGQEYLKILLKKVIPVIQEFDPQSLILSAGFDTYRKDPIGAFTLDTPDYFEIGAQLGALRLPTVIVQEGGYAETSLGTNVATFLKGVEDGRQTRSLQR